MSIITHLTDTDLYEFTMQQTILHHFPEATAEYTFKCRTKGRNLAQYKDQIEKEIDHLCTLKFTDYELQCLSNLDYMKKDYIQFLKLFQLNRDYIKFDTNGDELICRISGPMLHATTFEVYTLAIINEVYFRNEIAVANGSEGNRRLHEKIYQILEHPNSSGFRLAEFGTRRRFSKENQLRVVSTLQKELPHNLIGTSNVYLAFLLGLTPIGTMAHKYLQACQQMGVRLDQSQKFAFETWVKEYRGRLGIALTDVVGMDAFLKDFDLYFAKLFDGVRHDSGDPFIWAEKAINHYRNMRIDPRTKSLVFSDGLDVPRALALYDRFKNDAITTFCIGTNLSNDLGYTPLNIVIKMVSCNGQPTAKISDSPGKGMCEDQNYLKYLGSVFGIKEIL